MHAADTTDDEYNSQCPEEHARSLTSLLDDSSDSGEEDELLPAENQTDMMPGYAHIAATYCRYFEAEGPAILAQNGENHSEIHEPLKKVYENNESKDENIQAAASSAESAADNPLTPSALNFWRYGYFYSSETTSYSDSIYHSFTKLADQLAQIDESYIKDLSEFLANDQIPNTAELAERLRTLFTNIQINYYAQLKAKDDTRILASYQYHQGEGEPDNNESKNLNAYYSATLAKDKKKKAEFAQNLNKINSQKIKVDKLKFDLELSAKTSRAEKKAVDEKLEKLKDNIHAAILALGHTNVLITKAVTSEDKDVENSFHQKKYMRAPQDTTEKISTYLWSDRLALLCALLVGLGEGIVAAFSIYYKLLPLLALHYVVAIAIAVFLGAALCNYCLFHGDVKDTFRKMASGNFFKFQTHDGKDTSGSKKALVFVFAFLPCLAAGAIYGALGHCTSSSIFASLIKGLLALLHISATGKTIALAAGIIAAGPALATAIGLACIFFVILKDFIVEDRIIDVMNYFYFIGLRLHLSFWDNKHGYVCAFFDCLFDALFELSKVLIGLALNICVTIASFGVFHAYGLQLFSTTLDIGWAANTFSSAIAGITVGVNGLFAAEKIQHQINKACANDQTFSGENTTPKKFVEDMGHYCRSLNAHFKMLTEYYGCFFGGIACALKIATELVKISLGFVLGLIITIPACIYSILTGKACYTAGLKLFGQIISRGFFSSEETNILREVAAKSLFWQKGSMFTAIATNLSGQISLMGTHANALTMLHIPTAILRFILVALGMAGTSSMPMVDAADKHYDNQKMMPKTEPTEGVRP